MYGLEIKDLCVDLGGFKLDRINLNIRRGCITGLIGRNGAGKSTLIKTIMRQLDATSGQILYNGKRFCDNQIEVLNSVACVFDNPHYNTGSRPKHLVKLFKAIYKDFDMELYAKLMARFNLPDGQRISKFSFGMQKKYSLILGLCRHADILILDEPTSGIDPFDRNEIVGLIQEYMLDERHTVIFSTHITEDLDKVADYIVMMENGRITLNEDKNTLTESFRLVQSPVLTDEMRAQAIGVQQSMFGYTFLTRSKDISGEGVLVKVPTLEEMFVHMLGTGDYSAKLLTPAADPFENNGNKTDGKKTDAN